MLVVIMSMVAIVTIIGLLSEENDQTAFNRFCTNECIEGKHFRNNYRDNKLEL